MADQQPQAVDMASTSQQQENLEVDAHPHLQYGAHHGGGVEIAANGGQMQDDEKSEDTTSSAITSSQLLLDSGDPEADDDLAGEAPKDDPFAPDANDDLDGLLAAANGGEGSAERTTGARQQDGEAGGGLGEEEEDLMDEQEELERMRDSNLEEVPMDEEAPVTSSAADAGKGEEGDKKEEEDLDGLLDELEGHEEEEEKEKEEGKRKRKSQKDAKQEDDDLEALLGGLDSDEEGAEKKQKGEDGEKKDDTRAALLESIFGGDDDDDEDLSALLAADDTEAGENKDAKKRKKSSKKTKSGRRKRRGEEDEDDDEGDIEKKTKKQLEEILQQKDRKEQQKKRAQQRKRRSAADDADDADTPKKKRRRASTGDAPKRKQPTEEGEGEGAEVGEGDEGGQEDKSDFDLMLEKMKKSNRRRKNQLSPQQIDLMVETLLNKMADAVDADIRANREKSPAVAKIKLLSEVVSMLQKVHLQDSFIERGGLRVLKQWLEPLPDGSLPNFNIRRDILGILGKLPVSSDHLRESGIGKVVMFLYKSPKETKENKIVAQELIQNWSRPIFKLSLSYSDLAEHERERLEQRRQLRRSKSMSQSSSQTDDSLDSIVGSRASSAAAEEQFSYHARIPQPADKDYILRPVSQVELPPKSPGKALSKQKLFERRMTELKLKRKGRTINAQSRAARLSIEGRNLHH